MTRTDELEMKRIFICSPLRGDVYGNLQKAKRYARHAALQGNAVLVPHLLYTQFLDDASESERKLGIESGMAFLRACDELWAFASDYEHASSGMKSEIDLARKLENIKVIKFIDPSGILS